MDMIEKQNNQGIKTPHHPLVYLNGDFLPREHALLPITTQAFNYGTAVFEGIRGYKQSSNNEISIFRLDEHLKRFKQSASLLLIDKIPPHDELKEIILTLLSRNDATKDCYIRPIAFKSNLLPNSGFGVKLSNVDSGLSINSLDMQAYVKQTGICCTISNWQRVADNSIPARAKITGSYVNSALAMEAAQRSGYDDAIMLNNKGYVSEATTSNVFIIKNKTLITPPLSAHILEGITRDTVITLAKTQLKLNVEERDISPSELLTADESFLTGTGVEIALINQIDHHKLSSSGDASYSRTIKNIYGKIVRGEISEFQHWLTPLY